MNRATPRTRLSDIISTRSFVVPECIVHLLRLSTSSRTHFPRVCGLDKCSKME